MNFPTASLAQDRMPFVLVALAAALLCAAIIILLRPLLQRYALARPNARSSHVNPTPQGAGIAVITATLLAASVYGIAAGERLPWARSEERRVGKECRCRWSRYH